MDNLKLDDDVLNIPLFMADQADRFGVEETLTLTDYYL